MSHNESFRVNLLEIARLTAIFIAQTLVLLVASLVLFAKFLDLSLTLLVPFAQFFALSLTLLDLFALLGDHELEFLLHRLDFLGQGTQLFALFPVHSKSVNRSSTLGCFCLRGSSLGGEVQEGGHAGGGSSDIVLT